MDPFAVFGLMPAVELDRQELEARYLELTRGCHPDHHAGADADAQIALLTRAATVNEAYGLLRDRWRRAEALVELNAPQAMAVRKNLAPSFLADALELAEAVANAAPGSQEAAALRARIEQLIAADWDALCALIEAGDWANAATRLHQSRYHRKALHDLTR